QGVNEPQTQHMTCMEVWGDSQLTARGIEMCGLNAWVYSKPFGQAQRGGDVYYASSCATGRISRLLLADVSGHGNAVAATAADLRTLMRRFVNRLDQSEFVRLLNPEGSTTKPPRQRRDQGRARSSMPYRRGVRSCGHGSDGFEIRGAMSVSRPHST